MASASLRVLVVIWGACMAAGPPAAWIAAARAQPFIGHCSGRPAATPHPPLSITPATFQVLRPSIEPVAATDGLVHLAYAAQVVNTSAETLVLTSVAAVDPAAGFAPTGRNLIATAQGQDVAGRLRLFSAPADGPATDGAPEPRREPAYASEVPAGTAGVMFFDVVYADAAKVPRALAHEIKLAAAGGPRRTSLTDPVPVGCYGPLVLRPPLAGSGWIAFSGCCTVAGYHRDVVAPLNGALKAAQQYAIDFEKLGPGDSCCNGPYQAAASWWGYGAPVMAAAAGVVVEAVGDMPDQAPVGSVSTPDIGNLSGNHIIEDVGDGRYLLYAHLQPGSIPSSIHAGARLHAGAMIGRVGNSGNSSAPHLHFQAMDNPDVLNANGLPFVFDAQQLEGRVPEGIEEAWDKGARAPIDRSEAGPRNGLMPARNGVFGFKLQRPP